MMKIFCSWCGSAMGEKPGPAGMTSHGLCPICAARVISELDADAVTAERAPVLEVERTIEDVARARRAA